MQPVKLPIKICRTFQSNFRTDTVVNKYQAKFFSSVFVLTERVDDVLRTARGSQSIKNYTAHYYWWGWNKFLIWNSGVSRIEKKSFCDSTM
jgi:hypothetical protein